MSHIPIPTASTHFNTAPRRHPPSSMSARCAVLPPSVRMEKDRTCWTRGCSDFPPPTRAQSPSDISVLTVACIRIPLSILLIRPNFPLLLCHWKAGEQYTLQRSVIDASILFTSDIALLSPSDAFPCASEQKRGLKHVHDGQMQCVRGEDGVCGLPRQIKPVGRVGILLDNCRGLRDVDIG